MERSDKRRRRGSSEDEELEPTARAIKRAERKNRRTAFTTRQRSRSRSASSSESDGFAVPLQLSAAQKQALTKTRQQYEDLKADLLQFKAVKTGTLLDEANLDVQTRLTPLDIQRQKFINQSKMTKGRENETLARLKEFQSKIKKSKARTEDEEEEENWMANRLKFHIDSQRAYDVNKATEQAAASNFENFLTGGNENKKYANAYAQVKRPDLGEDVVQNMKIEEIVSMRELIELATNKKEET